MNGTKSDAKQLEVLQRQFEQAVKHLKNHCDELNQKILTVVTSIIVQQLTTWKPPGAGEKLPSASFKVIFTLLLSIDSVFRKFRLAGTLQAAQQAQRLDDGRVYGRAEEAALLARARPLPGAPEVGGGEQGVRGGRDLPAVEGAPQRARLLRPEPHAAGRRPEQQAREADVRGALERRAVN